MNDNRTRIEVLLRRVEDAGVREQLRRAIDDATEHRPLGLVFEEHMPEAIRLPTGRVRRGATVQYRDERDNYVWDVRRVRDGRASITRRDVDGSIVKNDDVSVPDLVVARRLGDPVYPGLTPLGTVERGGEKPHHIVIEGENFHALQTLEYTHKGTVDLIYIDPPYNTGSGDWIYNDRYVGDADSYRHSKWLSFMHRRLTLARELLSPTGVIIVAIDDNEHHRLRMLMDQVFGERNFLTNITWQGGGRNDARFTSGGIDYMVAYARSAARLVESDVRWLEPKRGFEEMSAEIERIWEKTPDAEAATKQLKKWLRDNAGSVEPGLRMYSQIDDMGRAFGSDNLASPNPRENLRYDVLHPSTGRPVKRHPNGWRLSEGTMHERIQEGRILFGPDETTTIRYKRLLSDQRDQAARPVIQVDRGGAARHLVRVLGSKDFPFPKDVDVIARWVNIATSNNSDAVVLDFFAGTGTTAEAVMRLNATDGGSRQSIMVTNNELAEKTAKRLVKAGVERGSAPWEAEGVFQKVTRPRIETVVTGSRPDGSEFSDGLNENVSFFKLEYLDRDSVEAGAAFKRVAELLWVKAGGIGPVITERSGAHAATDHYAVCFDADRFTAFVDEVNTRETIKVAYIVASSEMTFGTVKRALREDVLAVHLYENYLSNFEINTGVAR
ncbi:site-specific DNA-methyltransferase [Nesterenkonia sp. K-15-9-6]|uniref:site-specific DNA-methyltransferase n=1 Tax=Nesterenkonia sp. K-15-9-6 TaxID=3093918 RepID=UPI00404421DB